MAIFVKAKGFQELAAQSERNVRENVGLNNFTPGGTIRALIDSVSAEHSNMYNSINDFALNAYISTATGTSLDNIGRLYSLARKQSTRSLDLSLTNVRFFLDPSIGESIKDALENTYNESELSTMVSKGLIDTSHNTINIPIGITITNTDASVSYSTNDSVVLGPVVTEGFTRVTSQGVGTRFNVPAFGINRHQIAQSTPIFQKIASQILVENKVALSNASDTDTDENLRFKIANAAVERANANITSVRLTALSVPGVSDILLTPQAYGNGTLAIFVKSVDPIVAEGLLNAVETAVNNVLAVGQFVRVLAPSYLALRMQIELKFDPGADRDKIRSDVRKRMIDHINNLEIGGEVIINELIEIILSTNDSVKDMIFSIFGFGFYDARTTTVKDFTPLRLTNQKARWDEKWYSDSSLISICDFGATV